MLGPARNIAKTDIEAFHTMVTDSRLGAEQGGDLWRRAAAERATVVLQLREIVRMGVHLGDGGKDPL